MSGSPGGSTWRDARRTAVSLARRLALRTAPLAIVAAAAACASAPPAKPNAPHKAPDLHPARENPALEGPDAPPLTAYDVGTMQSDEVPAAVGRRGNDAVVAFARDGHLYTRHIDVTSGPQGDAVDAAPLGTLGTLGLRITPSPKGYVVYWDEEVDQNHIVKLLALDQAGKPAGSVLALAPISEHLAYAKLLAFDAGILLVHDIEENGASDVYVTPIDAGVTKAASAPQLVAKGALGWDVGAGPRDAVFAIVAPPQGKVAEGEPLGPVRAFTVDPAGKKSGEIHVLDQEASDIDVEVATIDGGAAIAFTDHTEMEGVVKVAIVKGGALAVPPKRVSPPLGDSAFVEIVSAPGGAAKTALVSWENVGESSDELRVIHTTTVASDGTVASDRGAFVIDTRAQAEIAADGDGFAMLSLAPASLSTASDASHADAPPEPTWPSFARVGPKFDVRGSEPVRFAGVRSREGVPDVTYGLGCDAGTCTALATSVGSPTELHLAVLPARSSGWRPIAWQETSAKPDVREARSLVMGDPLAKVAALELGGASASTLTAWTTFFVDGKEPAEQPPKGEAPYVATLAVRAVHDDGSLGEPTIVSKRATSQGGVAMAEAPNAKGKSDAVLAWVADEKGSAQVYVTRVDADGKKGAQKKLTVLERKKTSDAVSSASSTAIAYVPAPAADAKKKNADGFVVGWVDTRDKNGEVYVARINRDLDKVVVDKRVTNAPGDAADVDMIVRGNEVFVAYSDTREGGNADIYLAKLDAETLRVKDEGRVYASSAHSHAPHFALAGNQLVLAWIEDGADAAAGATAGATMRIAELDASGRMLSAPWVVEAPRPIAGTSAPIGIASLAIACSGSALTSCRVSFATGLDQGQALYGMTLGADGAPGAPAKLANLATAPLTDASLSFGDRAASTLALLEQGSVGRARLLKLDW